MGDDNSRMVKVVAPTDLVVKRCCWTCDHIDGYTDCEHCNVTGGVIGSANIFTVDHCEGKEFQLKTELIAHD